MSTGMVNPGHTREDVTSEVGKQHITTSYPEYGGITSSVRRHLRMGKIGECAEPIPAVGERCPTLSAEGTARFDHSCLDELSTISPQRLSSRVAI